ncbi:hypothetical protein [Mesorhizobium sp.]|uniref:hypothetical protein n=1 Tax=Mesorhizobium sp. TaxID=1871066 RepID=UPI000FE34612|nr:hypothetical protein [Mesorhizobium sp.]RWH71080.1 MAG: hypothetical protein EOQ84_17305 [Mesorhizobium sp.]RWL22431.1 MAG: hypothetical protein EOR58_27740 [Mesorhizobium sp.]RWL31520.1 MAG: hypothetical protein EOR63_12995 [Mesorhizobium sp.]RWL32732.1 MAG: hypothetical protein EOR59_26695 [Mesorhizobium sp.]RWL47091.1 MAG: hypothetical protein EOR61_26920 [Mesorhizobium sp.]
MEIPIVAAGAAALVALGDFQQIPTKAGLNRSEPPHQLSDVKGRIALSRQTTDRKACAGRKLAVERAF